MLEKRFARLNAIAKINSASKYLEVGVNKGITFNQVNVPFKVAVDPTFRFNTQEYANSNTIFHEVTSDAFFTDTALKYESFDLIYLDGLHTFEQTFRDFCASLRYSHSNTIWLIDDTNPISFFSADPDSTRARKLRRLVGDESKSWMGDVFKTIFAIHDFFPQFNYATFTEHGQTVLWIETRQDFSPVFNSLEKISSFKFDNYLEFKNRIMNFQEPYEIIEQLEKQFVTKASIFAA
jgi:hypothetical protein